jgi:hypothetical protein
MAVSGRTSAGPSGAADGYQDDSIRRLRSTQFQRDGRDGPTTRMSARWYGNPICRVIHLINQGCMMVSLLLFFWWNTQETAIRSVFKES